MFFPRFFRPSEVSVFLIPCSPTLCLAALVIFPTLNPIFLSFDTTAGVIAAVIGRRINIKDLCIAYATANSVHKVEYPDSLDFPVSWSEFTGSPFRQPIHLRNWSWYSLIASSPAEWTIRKVMGRSIQLKAKYTPRAEYPYSCISNLIPLGFFAPGI
ncbi:hypothetical protein OGATHE_003493 [Ogataea polymorpha]|uniref:Uncharacterized protein n=1 Tax=Ogataea polymorpha TaxID=460523 RepID=A0A9P8P350_9ASCO|nr:hypothetical protein OGATHE_003493 [Ogataea polymorpha]